MEMNLFFPPRLNPKPNKAPTPLYLGINAIPDSIPSYTLPQPQPKTD